jgi:phage baseplate assembly protein W
MANFMNRFKKLINNDQKEDSPVQAEFVDYKPEISPQGDFKITVDLDCVLHSWKVILMTPTRTYLFDPEFGSDIYKYVFEQLDNYSAQSILDETRGKIELYDTRIPLLDSRVVLLKAEKGFGVELRAEYKQKTKKFVVPILEESIMDLEVY